VRGQGDRRNNGADRGTHDPSLADERYADVAPGIQSRLI
jgi:hypothetical protein